MEDTARSETRVQAESSSPADAHQASASSLAGAPPAAAAHAELPVALLGAWFVVACLNLAVMLIQAVEGTRFPAYLFAFGHLLALGLFSAAVALAFRRWVSRRAAWGFAALGAGSLALAFGILGPDFANFVDKQAEAGSKIPWEIVAPAAVAGATLAAAVAARALVPWRIVRWLLVPLGVAVAVAGQIDVLGDYPGLRLFALLNAANLLSAPLLGLALPLPARLRAPWSKRAVLGAYALAAVASVLVPPRPSVLRALLRAPGSALAPHLVRLRPEFSTGEASQFATGEWFQPRDKVPPIPPSKPSLLPKAPLVIFITIDAVRGELLVGEKYRERLPNLFALRDGGVSFEKARSPSPSTLASVTSMFTGKYYSQIYWSRTDNERNTAEKDSTPRLAELLSAGGVRTLFIVNAYGTADRGGSRGFEKVVRQKKSFGPAKGAIDLMLKELKDDPGAPRFVYSHLVEPHYPYNRGGKHGSPFEDWLAEVASVDKQIGRLRKFLEKNGLEERTAIIISSDHGEAFGEHGEYRHAFANYEEFVHVPLIFYIPGVVHRLIKDPVSVMDVRPTLLDLFGLDTPGTDMGQSLVPYLRGENPKLTRPLVVDASRRMQAMVFPDNIKVMRNLRTRVVEIYDLDSDPGEKYDLLEDPSFDARPYENALAKFFEVHTLKSNDYEVPWQKF